MSACGVNCVGSHSVKVMGVSGAGVGGKGCAVEAGAPSTAALGVGDAVGAAMPVGVPVAEVQAARPAHDEQQSKGGAKEMEHVE